MTESGKDTSKANALHLDDFSVKQKQGSSRFPNIMAKRFLAPQLPTNQSWHLPRT